MREGPEPAEGPTPVTHRLAAVRPSLPPLLRLMSQSCNAEPRRKVSPRLRISGAQRADAVRPAACSKRDWAVIQHLRRQLMGAVN